MEGSLLQRGIGWYLKVDEATRQMKMQEDIDGPLFTGNINWGHVIGFGLGAIYVASPIDFIPDFIPLVGYIDDAFVLNFATSAGGFLWDMFD